MTPPPANPSEADVSPQVVQALEASGCILHRNNIGVAKFGPHWVRYGVGGKGGSDHIGFLPVRVTPAMVGQLVAVFVAPEVKRPRGGAYSREQIIFRNAVVAAGGIAGFCHNWEDGRRLVTDWFKRFVKKTPVAKRVRKA
jgi:hypothetical protein